ncbi:hypothetical protein K438DRAFT_1762130 [Mycena galopus ATCC 62051]|nr:hypothetical protein K438DRAFT_1762130 [Mycena galopus ATCC 62051]
MVPEQCWNSISDGSSDPPDRRLRGTTLVLAHPVHLLSTTLFSLSALGRLKLNRESAAAPTTCDKLTWFKGSNNVYHLHRNTRGAPISFKAQVISLSSRLLIVSLFRPFSTAYVTSLLHYIYTAYGSRGTYGYGVVCCVMGRKCHCEDEVFEQACRRVISKSLRLRCDGSKEEAEEGCRGSARRRRDASLAPSDVPGWTREKPAGRRFRSTAWLDGRKYGSAVWEIFYIIDRPTLTLTREGKARLGVPVLASTVKFISLSMLGAETGGAGRGGVAQYQWTIFQSDPFIG